MKFKRILKYLYRKIIIFFLDYLFTKKKYNFESLGSKYGSWSFINLENLKDSTIISCGVGEDISFDIEMIDKFNLKVILVDPTPKSIEHYNAIIQNLGLKRSENYSESGKQKISSYNLSKINLDNLILIKKAIWNSNIQNKKFFPPPNQSHVSYSLTDFSNNYAKKNECIEVSTITYEEIIKDNKINNLPLVKLDIEGSEIVVIDNLIKAKILPDQILVEFDELTTYQPQKIYKYYKINNKLKKKGYTAVKINNFSNQLYVRNECLKKLH
jgi:FkbM family methyltransferase